MPIPSAPAGDAATDAIEAGRRLFAGPCVFIAGAANRDSLPAHGLTEVAFAGRSNVGKSSLLNAVTGRRDLARTSSTPGRTQQINFFDLGGRLILVDLPGYGYSRAGKKTARDWTRLVQLYLRGRATLRRVMVLVDARRDLGPADREVMDGLDAAAVSYQVVLTKADKAGTDADSAAVVARRVAGDIKARPAAHPDVLVTSSADGTGIDELRAVLAALAEPEQLG
ncbi:MAG: YihA family ribosome biogenesis GTP-binding protein [Alphaproteobacteria bacterium]|nr:YihA family ribosome biogenesis GTP-binding protein [Alphaproteobacteria bacterium]